MLPTDGVTIRFPPVLDADETYHLLELPADILKAVSDGATVPLTIKGRPSDDAVLCTQDKTWALRAVTVSNSLMVLRPPPSTETGAHELHIRDIRHEVLECVPAAGRVERLHTVLRDSAWPGLGAGENLWPGMDDTPRRAGAGAKRKRQHKRYTRAQISSIVQASEDELEAALRASNVVEVDGYMLLLRPAELAALLPLVLALLTVHADADDAAAQVAAPSTPLANALATDHDVPPALTHGLMALFGALEGDTWRCDVVGLVRELGRGLLTALDTPRASDEFLADWRTHAGEPWSAHAALDLLTGDYLLRDPPPTAFAAPSPFIEYFPVHALPAHAPTRFADLFLTRQRWRPDDMDPFLRGLYPAGDTKARDKLVAKFVRVVKDRDGTWWYPRRTG